MGAPLHFEKHIVDISADTMGEIESKIYYTKKGNKAGNAFVYLIHKNGGQWWIEDAKKRFPNLDAPLNRRAAYARWNAVERLLKEDSLLLKDFNKWAFFIDKQYLHPLPPDGDDWIQVNEKGDYYLPSEAEIQKMQMEQLDYDTKPNTIIEVVLYEQKAGSNVWTAIDKKKFKTDADGDAIEPIDPKTGKQSCWECDFMRQKVKESNIPVQKN